MKYIKPPLPFQLQAELLIKRGLNITDIKHAVHVLEHINYYRLSAYFLPFQSETDVFNKGTSLDDILYLYEFDSKLRNLLIEGLARIEVSAKTQIAHHLALTYGPFGYTQGTSLNFQKPFVHMTHVQWLEKVCLSIKRSHEAFKKHFYQKYDEESYLPIWMAVELMSFGQISQLYKGMKKHDKQDIARGYFKVDQRLMGSWLHTIVYIRNLCAHNSRLWNRNLAIAPLPNKKDPEWKDIDNKKIFAVFLLIKKMMHFRDKWDQWSGKLLTLLGNYSEIDVTEMGFPEDWRELIFDHN